MFQAESDIVLLLGELVVQMAIRDLWRRSIISIRLDYRQDPR